MASGLLDAFFWRKRLYLRENFQHCQGQRNLINLNGGSVQLRSNGRQDLYTGITRAFLDVSHLDSRWPKKHLG